MMPSWSRSHCTALTGDGDRPLEGVDRLGVAELVGHRGEQPVAAADQLLAGVEQQEVAGAVGVLGLAGLEADLADRGRLLVAEDAGDRHLARPPGRRAVVVPNSAGSLLGRIVGSIARGMPKKPSSSSSQSRVVRSISMVRLALVTSVTCTPPSGPPVRFQTTQVSGVPKRASPRSAAAAEPVDVLEHPLHLAGREVGGRRQPGLVPDDVAAPVGVQRLGDRVGAGVLPDDGVVERAAGAGGPRRSSSRAGW